jgi:hypothetical protein
MSIRTLRRVEGTTWFSGRRPRATRLGRSIRRLTPSLQTLEERQLLSVDLWTQRGGDAQHAAYADVSVAPSSIQEAWDQPLTYVASGSWAQESNRAVAIDDTHVYRTDLDGYWASGNYHIIAYNLQTGAVDWNRTIVGNGPVSAPSVADGVVYVNRSGHSGISGGTADELPVLYGLSAQTGATVMQTTYAAQWNSDDRPTIDGGQVVSWDGYYGGFSSWSTSNLARQWNQTGSIYNPPRATFDSQYVYAYDNQVYQRSTGNLVGTITYPTNSTPLNAMVSDSGTLYFDVDSIPYGPGPNAVAAYDGSTHALLWTADVGAPVHGKAVGNGMLAVAAGTQLSLFNASTGAALGSWQAPNGETMTPEIVLTRTHAFVETTTSNYPYASHVYAVNLATGQTDWSFENTDRGDNSNGTTFMDMAYAGGHLVLSHDSFVRAFSVSDVPVNRSPVANDDFATTDEDVSLTLNALANDWDSDGDPVVVTTVGAASHGSAVLNADQSITYVPAANFNGSDSFTYTVSDGIGGLATATVHVTVNPVNDAPVVAPATFSLPENSLAGTFVGQVVANDVDGGSLTYSLDGNGSGAFAINAATGVISVADPTLLDYETQPQFNLTVHVSDGQGGLASSALVVNLTDVLEVAIDVLPSDPYNRVSLSSKDIEVAILGSSTFNPATMLDLSSLRLYADGSSSGAGVPTSRKSGYKYSLADVNGDGRLDLVIKFNTSATGLTAESTSLRLEGRLLPNYGGDSFNVDQAISVVVGSKGNGNGKGNGKK